MNDNLLPDSKLKLKTCVQGIIIMILNNKQKEEISELYSFGYFMNHVIEKRTDLDGNPLSDETILLLIDAESNLDLFTKMEKEISPCEMCGSHGTIKVFLGETPIIIREW